MKEGEEGAGWEELREEGTWSEIKNMGGGRGGKEEEGGKEGGKDKWRMVKKARRERKRRKWVRMTNRKM